MLMGIVYGRPLLPSTCQSVRMDFLALTPGVHSIDTLTLIDIQTGYTMNLRYVSPPPLSFYPTPFLLIKFHCKNSNVEIDMLLISSFTNTKSQTPIEFKKVPTLS